jgi:hypothetical protein
MGVAMGHRGSGKTTLIRQLAGYPTIAGGALHRPRRLLVCDPEKKWQPAPGEVLVESAGALLAYCRGLMNPRTPFRVVYRDDAEPMQMAGPGAAFALRNLTIVIDELAWMCHSGYLPPYLKRIVQYGRERRINLLGTTREPQEIHNLLVTQADVRWFFWTEQGNGLDRIRRWYRAQAEGLDRLPRLQYRTHGDAGVLDRLGREGLDTPSPRGPSSRRRRQA